MVSRHTLFFISLLPFMCSIASVRACNPVLKPDRVIVKHGDGVTVLCSSNEKRVNWEVPEGKENRTTPNKVLWKVDNLTEWGILPQCYIDGRTTCISTLNITVYKLPEKVTIGYQNHSGPMLVGQQHTLLCYIQGVAPIKALQVIFYRGNTSFHQTSLPSTNRRPENATFSVNITARREDDGAQYWCEAKLNLAPGGQALAPMKSEHLPSTVYYEPWREQPLHLSVSVTEGDTIPLNCAAWGNPAPTYNWTRPMASPSVPNNDSSLIIHTVAFGHNGTYTCVASNHIGHIEVTFAVHVKVDFLPIVAGLVGLAVIAAMVISCIACVSHYKHTKTGQYTLTNFFHLQSRNHVAQPNGI